MLPRLLPILLVSALCVAGPAAALRADEPDYAVDGTMPEDYLPALKTLITEALKQSPAMLAKELDINIANAQKLYNGIAPMLPNANGWLQYGTDISQVANNSSANNRNTGFYYDVQAHQTIFQWGQLRNQLQQSKINVAISERNYASAYQEFVQQMRRQYLQLILDKISLRNAQFDAKAAARRQDEAHERLKRGAIDPGQVMGYDLEAGDAKLQAETNEQTYLFDRRQLAREVGRKDLGDDEIPLSVPEPKYSGAAASELLAELLRTGARYAADSQIALLQINNAKLQYKYQKVNLLPKLSMQGEVNQSNQTNATPNSVSQTAVVNEIYFVRADWLIFDGLATRGRKQEALLRRRQAERNLQISADADMDAAQNAQRMAELSWEALGYAKTRYDVTQSIYQRAQDDLKRGATSEEAVAIQQRSAYGQDFLLTNARVLFLANWSSFVRLTVHDPVMNNLPARYVRPVQ